jgi:hypothetical protein
VTLSRYRIFHTAVSRNKYYVSVFLLQLSCMQIAFFLCYIRPILSTVSCMALPYFSILTHKRYDFRKEITERKMCVLIFSTTFV